MMALMIIGTLFIEFLTLVVFYVREFENFEHNKIGKEQS